ncbi:MAG: MFS transporter [Lutimonas sp.]
MKQPNYILPIIVISQFFCISLWFAGNGVMNDLISNFDLRKNALGHLTSAVQLGFILGALIFAIFTIADRYSPSKVFFVSALLGALCNLGILWNENNLVSLLFFRFTTGFFLAGIYPVGMKIAADYYEKGLGKALGFLVGALVLGTALPHLLKDMTIAFPWQSVLLVTSTLAVIGGLLISIFVPDGPFRKPGVSLDYTAFFGVFKQKEFRSAAFGYFGHMWELYTFWAFAPVILNTYENLHKPSSFNIPILSFFIIGIGGLACVLGSYISQKTGTKKMAFIALSLSCLCCLICPWMFYFENQIIFASFMLFWGMVVIADSPLFSTLIAQNVTPQNKGTALTIVNCIGFSITIISIQLLNTLKDYTHSTNIYLVLSIGPIIGLMALSKRPKQKT